MLLCTLQDRRRQWVVLLYRISEAERDENAFDSTAAGERIRVIVKACLSRVGRALKSLVVHYDRAILK
jgi:hypothetical protein